MSQAGRRLLLAAIAAMTAPLALADPRVLVYTATRGFRHDSIPTAIEVLGQRAGDWGVDFEFSEDPGMFTNETLSGFDGVMFVHNSDEVLDASGQEALATFFRSGGVYAGVHAASACLFNDDVYKNAVGALFDYHPTIQTATFVRLNDSHPATSPVPDRWTFEEEVYHFRSDPREVGAVVLLTVDDTSYVDNGTSTGSYPDEGDPHPIAWYIESPLSAQPLADGAPKAGRSFYTSLGHLNSTWQDETFQAHLQGGLKWALEGASTRAYGVGIVGNSTGTAASPSGSAAVSGSSGSGSATGSSSSSAPASGSGSATQSAGGAASTSGGAGRAASVSFGLGAAGVAGAVGAVVGSIGLGMGLLI